MNRCARWILSACVLFLFSQVPALGEAQINLFPAGYRPPNFQPGNVPASKGGATSSISILPLFRVDTTGFSDTTLWAVRNEGQTDDFLIVAYFDEFGGLQVTQEFTLSPREVKTQNVRDIAGLVAGADGVARGFIQFQTDNRASIDTFQIDVSEDLATGQRPVNALDFCSKWQVRFIKFTPADASEIVFFIAGPGGLAPNPPSIFGRVYSEAGVEENTFVLTTDKWGMRVSSADLSLPTTAAGVIEFDFLDDGNSGGLGYATVDHQAAGKFSAGLEAYCLDP